MGPLRHPTLTYARPVRPPVVIDVEAMQRVPALLGWRSRAGNERECVAGVAAGTHARRRELAIVRALGGSARLVRASVRWHALAVVGTGLVVGLPLGIALGRTACSAFAGSLGARPDPVVPFAWLGLLSIVVIVLGLAAAAIPGRRSTGRATVANALRVDTARTAS